MQRHVRVLFHLFKVSSINDGLKLHLAELKSFSASAFVVRHSPEIVPRTVGWLAMVVSTDGVLNAVVLSMYMHLLKSDLSMTYIFTVSVSKYFAIPPI